VLGAGANECDLVVKGSVGGVPRGWRRQAGGLFEDDLGNTLSDVALRALATSEGPLTYTCAPPGSGERMGIDRDEDSVLDGVDNCPAVSNPGQSDADSDGIGDVCDLAADTDSDGVDDGVDNCPTDPNPLQEDFDSDGLGDVCDPDDDNDGLSDDDEINVYGTNPMNADTDGDGYTDGQEVAAGTNPLTPNSYPFSPIPAMPLWGQVLLLALVLGLGMLYTARRRVGVSR